MAQGMTRRTLLGSVGAAAMFPPLATVAAASPPDMTLPALDVRLRIGAPQTGQGGRRHAAVEGGRVTGLLLRGSVQSGQLEWFVDPASGAVEVTARLQVRRTDGVLVELRDRTAHAPAAGLDAQPGWPTAPRLFEKTSGRSVTNTPLSGRLDTADLARGQIRLRAFATA